MQTLGWGVSRASRWFQRFRSRASQRMNEALLTVWGERLINVFPNWPFLAARRLFARRLVESDAPRLPVLLSLAAFSKRIPTSVSEFALLGWPHLKFANVDSVSARLIYWTGDHWVAQHAAGVGLWEQLCRRAETIVELGANIGYYTVVGGAAAAGTYAAYEPHPRSCSALRGNLAINGLDPLVTVIEAAAVPEQSMSAVELVCPTGIDRATPAGAMVRGSFYDDDPNRATESFTVPAVPFTDVIAGCDLLKIDVEGLEARLLTSAWDELLDLEPAIMIEVHGHNAELRAVLPQLIRELGAAVYAMSGDHLVPVGEDVMEGGSLDPFHTWDFLVVPVVRTSLVDGLVRESADA